MLESPPPTMSVMSNIANAKYEGLQYGKLMVNKNVKWFNIIFSKLMQIEVQITISQLLVLHMHNCWECHFFVYFAITLHG